MQRVLILAAVVALAMSAAHVRAASDPAETVRHSEQVLADLMAIPARQIPQHLLAEAQGIAIIPNVIKIGFVAGARRGHGVVMIRDAEGEWSLPQFVVLTGGSLGWQAGIQGTDVVLVFTARKGVEGLMKGKFTIGADASVSAGPLGRNAAAATDAALKSEILSYSRSRGLFAGISFDGSALEIDHDAHFAFYGSPTAEVPRQIPESAAQLRHYLVELTQGGAIVAKEGERVAPKVPAQRPEMLRRSFVHSAGQLHAILSPDWRQYLAIPKETLDPAVPPNVEGLRALQQKFAKIDSSPTYRQLAQRPEFQATHELLREYLETLSTAGPSLDLPPPPSK
jgi:lipid-binding SYLF domain-containing protein